MIRFEKLPEPPDFNEKPEFLAWPGWKSIRLLNVPGISGRGSSLCWLMVLGSSALILPCLNLLALWITTSAIAAIRALPTSTRPQ